MSWHPLEQPELPSDTHLKSIGTSISVKQQDEKPGHPISSGDESWFPVLEWRGKPGNLLSSPDNMECPGFSSCCFTEIDVPIDLRWVSEGISGLLQRMSSHLLYMMWNESRLWIQWRGNVLHLELIWGTPINFAFLRRHPCSSRLVTVLLGTF